MTIDNGIIENVTHIFPSYLTSVRDEKKCKCKQYVICDASHVT